MKILLINPPHENTITTNVPKVIEEGVGFIPPLGLMYIASYLEKNTGHKVEILDCNVENIDYKNLKKKIREKKPDIVGITAMTFTLIDVIKTAKIAKEMNPNIKVILGGPHPTIYPKETAALKEIDFCIIGEGEKPITELLKNINNYDKLRNVKGLAFKIGEEIIDNGQSEFISNLDEMPFPARHLILYKKYFSSVSPNFPITTMFTSRGCPYKCLFCDRPQLGKIFRARSPKNVVNEMEECQKMGIKEIFIYDDTFGVDRKRVIDICDEILKRNLKITWDVRTRVDTVDEEILTKMKKAGCLRIHYGVEAGTQKILNVLRKSITLEQIKKAFYWTKRVGIQTLAYFMIGSPTEIKEDVLATIKFMKKLNPDYAHIAITTPFPATDLYRMGLQEKVLSHDYWKEFAKNPTPDFEPYFWEKELSREELFSLLKKAYRSFYLRPSYVFKKIIQIKSGKELLTKARTGLRMLKI
jgi:radical SAM superfamily enzyme YgiQ (UPF0313 family)